MEKELKSRSYALRESEEERESQPTVVKTTSRKITTYEKTKAKTRKTKFLEKPEIIFPKLIRETRLEKWSMHYSRVPIIFFKPHKEILEPKPEKSIDLKTLYLKTVEVPLSIFDEKVKVRKPKPDNSPPEFKIYSLPKSEVPATIFMEKPKIMVIADTTTILSLKRLEEEQKLIRHPAPLIEDIAITAENPLDY